MYCANKSRFYCYILKRKVAVFHIFSHLTYKMTAEINSQIAFPQRLKTYFRQFEMYKKIMGVYSTPPNLQLCFIARASRLLGINPGW